jgi:hypothetical protein
MLYWVLTLVLANGRVAERDANSDDRDDPARREKRGMTADHPPGRGPSTKQYSRSCRQEYCCVNHGGELLSPRRLLD